MSGRSSIENFLTRKRSRSNSPGLNEMREDTQVGMLTLGELIAAMKEVLPTKEDFSKLNSEIKELKQENVQLREEVVNLRSDCQRNEDTIEFLLNKSKENNLVFKGIPAEAESDPAVIVAKLLAEVLELNGVKIVRAFFIGPVQPTRMILVEMCSTSDKWLVLQNVKEIERYQHICLARFLCQNEGESTETFYHHA